jgi:vacuolar-type H+-ATPase subunit I/STV1
MRQEEEAAAEAARIAELEAARLAAEEAARAAAAEEAARIAEELRAAEAALQEAQRLERMQRKLQELGKCCVGFRWLREGSGWRCAGGAHTATDRELGC